MTITNPFANQIISRDLLQQIFPYLSGQQLDTLLKSIDKDLQVPLRVDASSTPDLIVTIGPGIVDNSISGRQKSIPHILNTIPLFISGSVEFPSTDGGTITVSPGSNNTLTLPVNNYVKVLLSLDDSGNILVAQGTPDSVEDDAQVPVPVSNTLPFAYISLFNDSGVVQAISQNKIFQFGSGSGSGGGLAQAGFAQEEVIPNGATSLTVVFPTPLPGINYTVQTQLVNTTDANPQFQDVMVTNKTTNGFTAKWNAPTENGNYSLSYMVPAVQEQVGEFELSVDINSATVTLPLPLSGSNYSIIAQLVDYSDVDPQFQSVTITSKTNTDFTAKWNAPTDSSNYRLSYRVAQYQ